MIDRIFFAILLPLPLIVVIAMALYFARAWKTATPRLRISRILATIWLGACAAILVFCRERVRGWSGLDIGSITSFLIASAGVLVLIGVAVGVFATIGRSTKGSRLCPRCWYDMDGVDPQANSHTVCPECGTSVWSSTDLIRRKRWPVFIAVAVALQLAGQFCYQLIRADHGGAQNFVPTTVLVAGMFSLPADAIIGAPSPFDSATLTGRLANDKCADWQKSWAISKSIDAIGRAEHPDAVLRASTILNRCRFEGEIPFEAWKSSILLLCTSRSSASSEAFSYLAECYVRARGAPESGGRLAFAADPQRCATELRSLIPKLLDNVSTATVRTQEWWAALRLLALAGDASEPIVPMLEARVLTEDSEMGRANTAAVLSMFSAVLPDASDAMAWAFVCLPGPEQPRVLNAFVRFVRPPHSLLPSLRALANSGEPALEIAGAVGLLGGRATRCEGSNLLVRSLRRQIPSGSADFASIYWPVIREPGDDASTELITFLQEVALSTTFVLQVDAMVQLSNIARDAEVRSPEIVAFLDFVGAEHGSEVADRARALAADIRTARTAPAQLRKVAAIR